MTHLWHDIPAGSPEQLNAIIEIPEGSRIKYEVDKKTGLLMCDRIIQSSVMYPGNYGFVPQTLAEDDDPLDIIIVGKMPLHPGVLVHVRPLGALSMVDNGERDDKIICVLSTDKHYSKVTCVTDLPESLLAELEEFFRTYKNLDTSSVQVERHVTVQEAREIIIKAMDRYTNTFRH